MPISWPWNLSSWVRRLFVPVRRPIRTRPRTVRLGFETLETRWLPSTGQVFVVDNPGAPGPPGTMNLAQAILAVNADVGTGPADRIIFRIPGSANQAHTINIASGMPLPTITQPVIIDGWSEGDFENSLPPGTYRGVPLIEIHGDNGGVGVHGLSFGGLSAGSAVQGLAINNFSGAAIFLGTSGNLLQGNFLGTDLAGTAALGNGDGVLLGAGANLNTIGGTTAGAANIISGNRRYGVYVNGGTQNVVLGNRIGTDVFGTAGLGNANAGVRLRNAGGTTLGGTAGGAGNLISANGIGIDLFGASGTVVLGNRIGTDVTGTLALGNTLDGVVIRADATANIVGGTDPGAGNLISGNTGTGVLLRDGGTSGNVLLGNRIGTDVFGTAPLANARGVAVQMGAKDNAIGGPGPGAGNLISGNAGDGVLLADPGTTGNVVEGNRIGTDAAGGASLANLNGVSVAQGAAANTLGGNLISGNTDAGVQLTGAGTTGIVIVGNRIGTDDAGTGPLGNARGVVISGAAALNTVGGTDPATRNVIAGNTSLGVEIAGSATSANVLLGNFIGIDVSGTAPLGNANEGVLIHGAATDNSLGGTAAGAANVISGNADGVSVHDAGTTGNVVLGNRIGTDPAGGAALGNTRGVVIAGSAALTTVGGNVISGNTTVGLAITDAGTSGNLVLGNFIGTDAAGTAPLANLVQGVLIDGASANTVGGTATGAANVISGNGAYGIYLRDASGNLILGNKIGTDVNGGAGLGNGTVGVWLDDSSDNTVGGSDPGAGNVISANDSGVYLYGSGTSGNVVLGNRIGTDAAGTVALGNTRDGVVISAGATANTVGGTAPGAGNLISGNTDAGVELADTGTSGNLVVGNLIGTDVNGTTALANSRGVVLAAGAAGNTVGGTDGSARNVISGNTAQGVALNDAGTSGNVVLGNFVGTDVNGTAPLGNGGAGVLLQTGATQNIVGGTAAGAANVISGNTDGVYFKTPGTSGNVVLGNLIGTDASGSLALGNTRDGVHFASQVSGNTVGGTAAGAGNVISGNGQDGVYISDNSSGNVVVGNRIGTDRAGTADLGNARAGVLLSQARSNTVGGTAAGAANVISGNGTYGVWIDGNRASGNVVLGNRIGTDAAGTAALGNTNDGVAITDGAALNTVGSGNVISGNRRFGVYVSDVGTSGNVVAGNRIGTNAAGTAALANAQDGVALDDGATANTVGGTAPGAGNLISGNTDAGVELADTGTSGNLVVGNLIGTDVNGTTALANARGVVLAAGAAGNTVGGTDGSARNVISGNTAQGVSVNDTGTSGNVVLGNFIGADVNGTADLGNGQQGVLLQLRATGNTVGGTVAGAANVISGNTDGVYFKTPGTSGNVVLGNLIGTDASGSLALGNTRDGVHFASQVSGNTVGGTAAGAGNVISGNGENGVYISDNSSGNVVVGNRIGTDRAGTADLGNARAGVLLSQARSNTVGGTAAGAANVISGNGTYGVWIDGNRASGNVVLGNRIGTDAAGTASLGNTRDGVAISNAATLNTVGGTDAGAGNLISANGRDGVNLSGAGTSGNVVAGNRIGTTASGTTALGNARNGVFLLGGAADNLVGGSVAAAGNVIAFNAQGVVVGASAADTTTVHNSIRRNSIFGNTGVGIDLGNNGFTPNGTNPRAFPNDGQNAPVITAVTATSVSGTLTTANGTYRVELFASPVGSVLQGKTYLGFVDVTVTTGGKAFTAAGLTVPAGSIVTATATNLANGDTSEFSQLAATARVTSNPTVTTRNVAQTVTLTAAVTSPATVNSGTVTFTIQGLPGSVTASVNASGVATATFPIPANVVPGRYKIIAVYTSQGGSFADSTSDPRIGGLLTVLYAALKARR